MTLQRGQYGSTIPVLQSAREKPSRLKLKDASIFFDDIKLKDHIEALGASYAIGALFIVVIGIGAIVD